MKTKRCPSAPAGGFAMTVKAFDHVAIPVANPEEMLRFYRAMGFSAPAPEEFREQKMRNFSVVFGDNKINMHAPALWQSDSFTLRGPTAKPGCGDFCFVWDGTIASLQDKLREVGAVPITEPVDRVGG